MEDHCYCQSYYYQPIAETEEKAIKAARMCNYMNFHLQWDYNSFFEHIYIFHEEEANLLNCCLIRYELLDEFFDDAINHILNYSVQQIADDFCDENRIRAAQEGRRKGTQQLKEIKKNNEHLYY